MNGMQLFCYSEMIHRSMVYIVTGVVYTCYRAVVRQYWSTRILIVFQLELSSLRYNVARSMFSAFDLFDKTQNDIQLSYLIYLSLCKYHHIV